jgi:carboxypeptidase C (cathepsin A)
MTTDQSSVKPVPHQVPTGARKHFSASRSSHGAYQAVAEWILLTKEGKPTAEIFSTAYFLESKSKNRPITFVFNGGPGASSAYLHVGALGPQRVVFDENGQLPQAPVELTENKESWLELTDLVFVDPVDTGFSRSLPLTSDAKEGSTPSKNTEYLSLNRDLDALCEFVEKFLSQHNRWKSAVFIAGESYGGYRVGRLAKKLQEGTGVGLNGAILISPALELSLLSYSDYNILPWLQVYPSYVLTAQFHGRSQTYSKKISREEVLRKSEDFARNQLASLLIDGNIMSAKAQDACFQKMSNDLGISKDFIALKGGRISIEVFCRELLRDQRRVVGLYDGSLTATDPFPDRSNFEGADPTLYGIERIFCAGINVQMRESIGLKTDREYRLLNMDVFKSWRADSKSGLAFDLSDFGATDDLRYATTLNPHIKVLITHGYFDLVTPYYSSELLVHKMKLSEPQSKNVQVQHFDGGHMFYTWESSRKSFRKLIDKFYLSALAK